MKHSQLGDEQFRLHILLATLVVLAVMAGLGAAWFTKGLGLQQYVPPPADSLAAPPSTSAGPPPATNAPSPPSTNTPPSSR